MGNYEELKAAVASVIKTNGNQEITGQVLQNTLTTLISQVGANATFAGIATPDTAPGIPDQNVFYLALSKGVYVNFDGFELTVNAGIFINSLNKWECIEIPIQISGNVYHSMGMSTINIDMNLKSGDMLAFEIVKNNGGGIDLYGKKGSIYTKLSEYYETNKLCYYKFNNNYDGIRFYNKAGASYFDVQIFPSNGTNLAIAENTANIAENTANIAENTANIAENTANIERIVGIFEKRNVASGISSVDISGNFKAGDYVIAEILSDNSPAHSFTLFGKLGSGSYENLYSFTDINTEYVVKIPKDYVAIRFYNNTPNRGAWSCSLNIDNAIAENTANIAENTANIAENTANIDALKNSGIKLNLLVLGDSYSASPYIWITKMINMFAEGSSYVNLAVGSACIRDKYSDRNTYPYTSRPVQADSSGNKNVFACQIEKLKRLMLGTDLDEGEKKIYETEDSYPNVIIIEGGMNDQPDAEDVENTYISQFETKVDNVWNARNSNETPSLGSVYIKTPIEDVNRTCFAGAYRYIVEELSELFPNAQIFFTLSSGLGYWRSSVVEKQYNIASQQSKCAKLCSVNIIDWHGEGQVNSIYNYPIGDGTQENPYLWSQGTGDEYADTNDLLHPNQRGGYKYAKLAYLCITQRFLDINNWEK